MLSERLKEIRKELRLTQDEFANSLGLKIRTYASYERAENEPPYSMLVKLCETYNINANWLLCGMSNMFNQKPFEQSEDELEQKVVEVMKKYGVIEK